jgi:hypothetical protein
MIIWDYREYLKFLVVAFLFFLPFLIGATGLGAYFIISSESAGAVYFVNLIGSAAGLVLLIIAMISMPPSFSGLPAILMSSIGLVSIILCYLKPKEKLIRALVSLPFVIIAIYLASPLKIQISEYKSLSRILRMPESRIVAEKFNPLGWLVAVESPSFHHMPGVSLNYTGIPPEQIGLFLDGELLGAIDSHQNESTDESYINYTPSTLPYSLLARPSVMIIGARGGSEIYQALSHDALWIDVVDVDEDIRHIVDDNLRDFSKAPYSSQNVRFTKGNPRNIIRKSDFIKESRMHKMLKRNLYDLIIFPPAGSEASTVAGMSALSENYLFTVESITDFLKHIQSNGYIYLSAWIQYPPKEGIKLFALAVEALDRSGIKNPEKNLFAYRSWNTCSIILSPSPLGDSFTNFARNFLIANSFDPIYFYGITPEQSNRFNFMDDDPYYNAAQEILSSNREQFYTEHLFNITPPTDDKPFLGNFLKWKSIPVLLRTMKADWIPFMDWGQLLTVVAFIHALFIGLVLIFLPLISARIGTAGYSSLKIKMVVYFASIGIGFFLLEIGFIQRFSLVLMHPTYSSFIIVILFLIGAGLGSIAFHHIRNRILEKRWKIFAPILLILVIYMFFLQSILHYALNFPFATDIIIACSVVLPLAFFMGMAFPCGLEKLGIKSPDLIPWAWGVNAYASVVSGTVIPLIAQSGGFSLIILLACLCYFSAWIISLTNEGS